MPRTLPAALESAMDSGVFKAYIAIGQRNYDAIPPTALVDYTTLITNILYYEYDGLELTIKWASPNLPEDDGLTLGNKYYIERGVTIAGVNHTIKSASLRFDDYTVSRQIITAQFSLFSTSEKPDTISGDDTYTNVLTALNPNNYYLGTVDFKSTPENTNHWGYQFYGTGKQIILKSYASLLPILKQKYLIQITDNSDDDNENEIQYFHLRSPASSMFWSSTDTVADAHFCVCWSPELSLFAAGGAANVYTSPNGSTWTSRVATITVTGICWSAELSLFVGVSNTNKVTTSPDGITWTERSAVGACNSVVWSSELSLFVAVGSSRVMTSPDGITWTDRNESEANAWQGIAWSSELALFVAVAGSGTNRVMTSPDGIAWTNRSAAEANDWLSVCWSSELNLFVAVADTGTNRTMTSPDGITWTSRTAAAANQWRSVTYSDFFNIFLAVAATGTGNRLMTSPDGITWTSATTGQDSDWYGVAWSEELGSFVTVANAGATRIALSLPSMLPDHIIRQGDVVLKTDNLLRKFLWRDEASTIHTDGDDNDIIHNLGYLESTDLPPSSFENASRAGVVVGIHLKYKTGDIFSLEINTTQKATYLARVTEILDPSAEIGWRCEIELIERFSNTDGGPLPSTIERVSAYTPLVTTNFNSNLDQTVNNLQALAEKVDDLNLGSTDEEVQDIIGAMLTGNTETGIAVTYDDTNGKLDFDAQTAGDARYAPITKGVTNGDSHNHVGGDGAAIYTEIPLVAHGNSGTIPASTTYYLTTPFTALSTTSIAAFIPTAGTIQNFYLRTASAQPASGTLVCTVTINGVDSALTFTVPTSGAAGTYSDTTHSASISAGDRVGFKLVNNATGASAGIGAMALGLKIANS